MKAVVFFLWCVLVFGLMSLAYGFFALIDAFHQEPKDDDDRP